MTLSLIYAFHFLLSNALRRINSPLFTVPVKGKCSGYRKPPSVQAKKKINQNRHFFSRSVISNKVESLKWPELSCRSNMNQ